MDNTQFSRFAPLLRDMTEAQLASEIERPRRLLLATGMAGGKRIDIAYAPLDHVKTRPRRPERPLHVTDRPSGQ
jgi:hypothetical protein